MAQRLIRGQIWRHGFGRPDKKRPVLILTRNSLIHHLNRVTVAAITSTIRGLPTEVVLDTEVGLKHESSVNLINVFTVDKAELTHFIGTVPPHKMEAICRALNIAMGCF
jgi:mRNA interferase MazF